MKEAHNSTSLGFDPKGIQFEPTDEVARKQGIGGSEAYAAANVITPEMESWATTQFERY